MNISWIRLRIMLVGLFFTSYLAACVATENSPNVATRTPQVDTSAEMSTTPTVTVVQDTRLPTAPLTPAATPRRPPTVVSCADVPTPAPSDNGTIYAYFTCGDEVRPVVRQTPDTTEPELQLQAALNALVAGPTDAEQAAGFTSFFSPDSAGVINTVTITDGANVVVNFSTDVRAIPNASTTNGARTIMWELTSTVFQFPDVQTIRYQMDGSCDLFYHWLQSACQTISRDQWQPPQP
jgi:spore germination protein GerM